MAHQRKTDDPGQAVPQNVFQIIPQIIEESGRVAGFEKMRDIVLEKWKELHLFPGLALKAALELDRHALFAEALLLKAKSGDSEGLETLQGWLSGDVADMPDTPPRSSGGRILAPDMPEPIGEGKARSAVKKSQLSQVLTKTYLKEEEEAHDGKSQRVHQTN